MTKITKYLFSLRPIFLNSQTKIGHLIGESSQMVDNDTAMSELLSMP